VREGGSTISDVGWAKLGYRLGISKKSIKYFNYTFAVCLLCCIEIGGLAALLRRYQPKGCTPSRKESPSPPNFVLLPELRIFTA
jgi:hypothetical protein